MNKKWAAALIPVFMMTTLGTADVDASWWSKTMKKLDKWASQSSSSSSSSSSDSVVAEPTQTMRNPIAGLKYRRISTIRRM